MKSLIELRGVSKSYAGEKVIEDFSLQISSGEILVMMGPSGTGKSTLLNLIGGIEKPDSGEILYAPELSKKSRVFLPFVFQESDSLLPWLSVYDNVRIVNKEAGREEILRILETVELAEHKDKFPGQLSGGMKQRLGIARALVCNSGILLMDEPFGSLDAEMRRKLQDFLLTLQAEMKITIIFVTHDLAEAEKLGDRIINLNSSAYLKNP